MIEAWIAPAAALIGVAFGYVATIVTTRMTNSNSKEITRLSLSSDIKKSNRQETLKNTLEYTEQFENFYLHARQIELCRLKYQFNEMELNSRRDLVDTVSRGPSSEHYRLASINSELNHYDSVALNLLSFLHERIELLRTQQSLTINAAALCGFTCPDEIVDPIDSLQELVKEAIELVSVDEDELLADESKIIDPDTYKERMTSFRVATRKWLHG